MHFIKIWPKKIILVIDAAYAEYVDKEDYTPGDDLVKIIAM